MQKASGCKIDADINRLNLAQKLTDQMVVYVSRKGETIPISVTNDLGPSNNLSKENNSFKSEGHSSSNENKINLNIATLEQLKNLTGIGEKGTKDFRLSATT